MDSQQAGPSQSHNQPQPQYLGDLEKSGISTSNTLRELLTTCPDPVEGIRNFQSSNSIQLSSLGPVMKLLDLHGIRRTEYHEAVLSELTDKITTRLRAFGEKQTAENVQKLEQHLERCFRLYRVPRIRPIVLETLAQLPKVADRYLKLIICDKEFYDQCAVSVKQQIWIKNESLFLAAVEPVLAAYINEKEQFLLTGGIGAEKQNFFTCDSWKGRRQKKLIQELISMIGQRESLYSKLIEIIRARFLFTQNTNYCSLRFELLMAAHDVNMEFLIRVDPCHDFAWCLDGSAKHHRARLIDAQQMSKLKAFLDTGKKGHNKNIVEMSMIAGDPHILHMIASAAIKTLKDNAGNQNALKPRDLSSVHLMVKLLLLGMHANELLTEQTTLAKLMDPEIFTVFLTALCTMMVRDVIRSELSVAPEEVAELFAADREICVRPPSVDRFLASSPVCALLWIHHLAIGDALPSGSNLSKRRHFDPSQSLRYLDVLPQMINKIALGDHWAHLLTHRLMHCPAIFTSESSANMLIRRHFLPQLKKVNSVKFHLLHLCVQHCAIIPPDLFISAFDHLITFSSSEEPSAESFDSLNFFAEFDKHREQLTAQRQQAKKEAEKGRKDGEEKEEGQIEEEDEFEREWKDGREKRALGKGADEEEDDADLKKIVEDVKAKDKKKTAEEITVTMKPKEKEETTPKLKDEEPEEGEIEDDD